MIEIRKGNRHLLIPAGSLKRYLSAGWSTTEQPEETNDDVNLTSGEEELQQEYVDPEEEDVEYVDPEELAQRPLSELDREELRILAEYKGIDVSGLTSTKQLRNAIRNLE